MKIDAFLADVDPVLFASPEGRSELCREDPLMFALVYFPHLLQDRAGQISLAEPHVEWCEIAKLWISGAPSRDAFVAPRELGKTTWWLLILPLWGAAFGHVEFVFWAADAARQAQDHLGLLRAELASNELLRHDFPLLCEPMKRGNRPVADREDTFWAASGFYVTVRGLDGAILGIKDRHGRRPDLVLIDDGEPGEGAGYSLGQKEKRLMTLLDEALPTNELARVVLTGTVTMPGSITHDLVRSLSGEREGWVASLYPPFQVHHHMPFRVVDGAEESIWPEHPKFDMEFMNRKRGTASFAKNYLNQPIAGDSTLWGPDSFTVGSADGLGPMLLSLDPAMTSKKTSDFTGIALLSLSAANGCVVVHEAWQVRVSPEQLHQRVLQLCDEFPVGRILVETNQGGDYVRSLLADSPVKVMVVHQSKSKEVRAARAFTQYERGKVLHEKRLPVLEEAMMAFPAGHDDAVDAVTSGVGFFLDAARARRQRAGQGGFGESSWIG